VQKLQPRVRPSVFDDCKTPLCKQKEPFHTHDATIDQQTASLVPLTQANAMENQHCCLLCLLLHRRIFCESRTPNQKPTFVQQVTGTYGTLSSEMEPEQLFEHCRSRRQSHTCSGCAGRWKGPAWRRLKLLLSIPTSTSWAGRHLGAFRLACEINSFLE
jgi:hypothetical protein